MPDRTPSSPPRRRRLALASLVLAVTLLPAPPHLEARQGSAPASPPALSTFSIVACDRDAGFWGVAIQSRVVSAGSIVPAARAGVGAIATQAAANVTFKEEGLRLLAEGLDAEEVRARFVESDPGEARRQFAIVDRDCRVATHTGESTLDWAGHRVGPGYSVQGNILTGPEVVDAMAEAYEQATTAGWPFGERLLAAVKAGQDAGGDSRGRQGAGLLIVREGGGYGGGDDRYADLRVEDHVEPILELERVYDVWMRVFHPADHFVPVGRTPVSVPSGPHICRLREMLTTLGYDRYEGETGSCAFAGEVLTALSAFQRDHGLREVPAVDAATARRLREAVAERTADPGPSGR